MSASDKAKVKKSGNMLEGISSGRRKLTPSESFVLEKRGLIKPTWKKVPYIDNPKKKTNVFDKWVLTEKGKHHLKVYRSVKKDL